MWKAVLHFIGIGLGYFAFLLTRAMSPEGGYSQSPVQEKATCQSAQFVMCNTDDSPPKIITTNEYDGKITSVVFNHDSSAIASSSYGRGRQPVYLWTFSKDKPTAPRLITKCDSATQVEFALKGKILIVTLLTSPTVKIYNISGDAPKEIAMPWRHKADIHSIAVSPTGDLLATAGTEDLTARIWKIKDHEVKELYVLRGHTDSVFNVIFSRDGRSLVTLGGDGFTLWDISKGEPEKKRFVKTDSLEDTVESIDFSSDGKSLIIAMDSLYGDPMMPWVDCSVSTYSIVDSKVVNKITMKRHTSKFVHFKLSPNQKTAITTYKNGDIILRDAKTLDEIKSWKMSSQATSVSYSPDSKYAVTGNASGVITILDLSVP